MAQRVGETTARVSRQARNHAANPLLRIDGCVDRPLLLTPSEVSALPHAPFLGQLSCNEAGIIPARAWSGVRIADLLVLAHPGPEAKFVRVSGGPYGYPIPIDQAQEAILCDRLDDAALAVEHGGPWRLVIPGTRFFTSVKWVDRMELTVERPDDSATRIALARSRASRINASV